MSFELWEYPIIKSKDVTEKDKYKVINTRNMQTNIGGCCGADFNSWATKQWAYPRTFNLFTDKQEYHKFCESIPEGDREFFEINTSQGVLYLVTQKHKRQP